MNRNESITMKNTCRPKSNKVNKFQSNTMEFLGKNVNKHCSCGMCFFLFMILPDLESKHRNMFCKAKIRLTLVIDSQVYWIDLLSIVWFVCIFVFFFFKLKCKSYMAYAWERVRNAIKSISNAYCFITKCRRNNLNWDHCSIRFWCHCKILVFVQFLFISLFRFVL